jgi:hypothetical protein
MQDRPTAAELLAAIEAFLGREILPHVEEARRFHARVALNALGIVRREIALEDAHLAADLAGLSSLLGPEEGPGEAVAGPATLRETVRRRTEELCERIRRGEADRPPFRAAVMAHLRAAVRRKLEVTNPRWPTG